MITAVQNTSRELNIPISQINVMPSIGRNTSKPDFTLEDMKKLASFMRDQGSKVFSFYTLQMDHPSKKGQFLDKTSSGATDGGIPYQKTDYEYTRSAFENFLPGNATTASPPPGVSTTTTTTAASTTSSSTAAGTTTTTAAGTTTTTAASSASSTSPPPPHT
jgi:hypothetical protein